MHEANQKHSHAHKPCGRSRICTTHLPASHNLPETVANKIVFNQPRKTGNSNYLCALKGNRKLEYGNVLCCKGTESLHCLSSICCETGLTRLMKAQAEVLSVPVSRHLFGCSSCFEWFGTVLRQQRFSWVTLTTVGFVLDGLRIFAVPVRMPMSHLLLWCQVCLF